MNNAEHIEMAETVARALGVPAPRTKADVENLTNIAYYGPDPASIGVVQHLTVQTY